MLDIKWIRENPAAFDDAMRSRGAAPVSSELLEIDRKRRELIGELQALQERRNAASKEIGKALGAKDADLAEKLKSEVATIKTTVQDKEDEGRRLDAELKDALSVLPNLPLDGVPVGADEAANVEVRRAGDQRNFAFDPKEHYELGEAMGEMDFERAAKISGSRFVVLTGALARLERALGQFMLDLHTTEHGYTEVNPPLLVRDKAMYGTGQLPKFEDDLFKTSTNLSDKSEAIIKKIQFNSKKLIELQANIQSYERDIPNYQPTKQSSFIGNVNSKEMIEFSEAKVEQIRTDQDNLTAQLGAIFDESESSYDKRYLIPTAEVSLTNLVADDILDAADLPLRFTALTACFRSEAGSAGRDTRGMLRQHQFYKCELVSITADDKSLEEHERMTQCAETVLKRLDLPFRTMVLSTGDMGFGARKTYDVEVWLPGQGAYREISSCSVCGDFQARRMNARYRAEGEKQTRFVHTLNGSGVAVGRAAIAVMENYQNEDGSIAVPDALKPYMGGLERIGGAN